MIATIDWLLASPEPWTRYRTLRDLLGRTEDDPEVRAARADMLAHPQVQALVARAATWGSQPFTRHNDAITHPANTKPPSWPMHLLHECGTLASLSGSLTCGRIVRGKSGGSQSVRSLSAGRQR